MCQNRNKLLNLKLDYILYECLCHVNSGGDQARDTVPLIQEEIKHVTVSMLNKLIERGHNLACVLLDDTSNQGKRVALQQLGCVAGRG